MLVITLMFCLKVTVFAEGLNDLGKIVDGSVLTNEVASRTECKTLAKGNVLDLGTASISNKGNGVVNISGTVFGSVVCDKLILKMTLQRYENGIWKNVMFFSDEAYNQASLNKSYNITVTKGYYYRNKAICVAWKGSTTESKMPITDGIWID